MSIARTSQLALSPRRPSLVGVITPTSGSALGRREAMKAVFDGDPRSRPPDRAASQVGLLSASRKHATLAAIGTTPQPRLPVPIHHRPGLPNTAYVGRLSQRSATTASIFPDRTALFPSTRTSRRLGSRTLAPALLKGPRCDHGERMRKSPVYFGFDIQVEMIGFCRHRYPQHFLGPFDPPRKFLVLGIMTEQSVNDGWQAALIEGNLR